MKFGRNSSNNEPSPKKSAVDFFTEDAPDSPSPKADRQPTVDSDTDSEVEVQEEIRSHPTSPPHVREPAKLVAAPRVEKGAIGMAKKFISKSGKEKRTQMLFAAILLFAFIGFVMSCQVVLFPADDSFDPDLLSIPADAPTWAYLAAEETAKYVEGDYANMKEFPGQDVLSAAADVRHFTVDRQVPVSFNKSSGIETYQIAVVASSVSPAVVYDTGERGEPNSETVGLLVTLNLKLENERVVHAAEPVVEPYSKILRSTQLCDVNNFTTSETDINVLRAWADAWLKGNRQELFVIAGETDGAVEYSGWGNKLSPFYLVDLTAFYSSCSVSDGEDVMTLQILSASCETGTRLNITQNIRIASFGTPNPIIKAWSNVNQTPPASSGIADDDKNGGAQTSSVTCPGEIYRNIASNGEASDLSDIDNLMEGPLDQLRKALQADIPPLIDDPDNITASDSEPAPATEPPETLTLDIPSATTTTAIESVPELEPTSTLQPENDIS